MTVLAYGGGHFVAAVSLAAIIISVIYHHYLILVSGEVLYELIRTGHVVTSHSHNCGIPSGLYYTLCGEECRM